ncbi:hypothetical protein Tco_0648806 [Tanacetum coccineum]
MKGVDKKKGKQPVVDLDEDDDDDMAAKRAITRWNRNEEILLAETWIEHSQDANIRKDQQDDVYWNPIMQDFNSQTTDPPRAKIQAKRLCFSEHVEDDISKFVKIRLDSHRIDMENSVTGSNTVKNHHMRLIRIASEVPGDIYYYAHQPPTLMKHLETNKNNDDATRALYLPHSPTSKNRHSYSHSSTNLAK